MTQISALDSVDLDRLYEAAESIRDAFAPLAGTSPAVETIDKAERSVYESIRTIYLHLYAMAVAELETKSRSAGWYFLSTVSYEFEEIAHISAEIPYSKRGDDGFFEIIDLILRFFSTGDGAGRKDLFYFLMGITANNVNSALKEISRTEKRLHHYIYTAVIRHLREEPRYIRSGETIVDLSADDPAQGREATVEEVVAGCAGRLGGVRTPGAVVDMIFDCIREMGRFTPGLELSTIRSAVYELIKGLYVVPSGKVERIDPLQDYLQSEMLRLADEALAETAGNYGWREGGSAGHKEAFEKAGRDMLAEIIVHGRKIPHHEALGRHIEGCGRNEYRDKHMGSFQGFWKALWENFLKKIRADI